MNILNLRLYFHEKYNIFVSYTYKSFPPLKKQQTHPSIFQTITQPHPSTNRSIHRSTPTRLNHHQKPPTRKFNIQFRHTYAHGGHLDRRVEGDFGRKAANDESIPRQCRHLNPATLRRQRFTQPSPRPRTQPPRPPA